MSLEKLFELGEIYHHLPSVRQQVRFIKINIEISGALASPELLC